VKKQKNSIKTSIVSNTRMSVPSNLKFNLNNYRLG